MAQRLRSFHSLGTARLLSTSDRCASVHVSSLGRTDRWPEGRTCLLVPHSPLWLDFTHTGQPRNFWLVWTNIIQQCFKLSVTLWGFYIEVKKFIKPLQANAGLVQWTVNLQYAYMKVTVAKIVKRKIHIAKWVYITLHYTRSSAIVEGPRDASCQLISCQLPRNSAKTTCTTSPEQIDVMKLKV